MRNNGHLNKSSLIDNSRKNQNSPLSISSLTSPMGTRQRRNLNSSVLKSAQLRQDGTPEDRRINNSSVVSGAGPLLSSPFMPQIKRALGLEPNVQQKYGEHRRHSFSLNVTSPTVTSSSLPHVKLNRARRLSLTERNTSMLSRSSTVKIAPPVIGKVNSPSLYHLRCHASTTENRGTPDTNAVISALKDRRKRSVTVMDEAVDTNTQQAKRRRQESQHSNASTSSMPSMPEHFPELTGADFSIRLETPGIKRPSRPSQADDEDWHHSEELKRQKCQNKNNSILSSLSSSERFIQHQKRKSDSSFTEKENKSGYGPKSQRKEPPRLTHLDVSYRNNSRSTAVTVSTNNSQIVSPKSVPSVSDSQTQKSPDVAVSMKTKLPSMKKTASMYSGLGSPATFKKVQYANVVATLDDYDSDREVEQQRVKQMLKDLDDSFTTKQAEKDETKKKDTPLSVSSIVTSVTPSVTIATTPKLSTTSTSSVLSALEKLSKSPVQETEAPGIPGSVSSQSTSAVKPVLGQSGANLLTGTFIPSGAGSVSATSSVPASSVAISTQLAPSNVAQSATVGSGLSSTGGFSFDMNQKTSSLSGQLTGTTSSAVFSSIATTAVSLDNKTAGNGGFNFVSGTSTPSSSVANTTGLSTSVVSAATPAGGFSFGIAGTGTTGVPVSTTSSASDFKFGMLINSSTVKTTSLTNTSNLFGSSTVSSATPSLPGFNVPASTSASTGPSIGGFTFGSSAPATISSGLEKQAQGFSFSSGTNTGTNSNAPNTANAIQNPLNTTASITGGTSVNLGSQISSTPAAAFSFNAGTASMPAATSVGPGLFQFVSASTAAPVLGTKTTGQSTVFGSTNPTPAFGSTNQPPAFGSANQTPAFGSTNQPPAFGSANQTPAFGSTNQPPAFGSANQPPAFGSTNQTPAFGSTNQPPAYGSANQPPAFGSANQTPAFGSTNQTPAFGSTNPTPTFGSTNQAPAFGSANPKPAFGSSTQTPAFGTASPAPAFGSSNPAPTFGSANPTPAFGSSNPTPAFGSANPTPAFGSTNQAPAFGTTAQSFGATTSQKSNTPVFGATTNNSNGSVFGTSTGGTTGFGKSQSMPVFGTTNNDTSNNANTFNFGAPAPNVNPFGQGQTTPAKQTGSAFGQVTADSTPKSQTGALFQFGQANKNSSVSKGFDFSNSSGTGAANPGGFNFNTPTAAPNFGTPGSTPGFSLGTSETAPRANRPRARVRRQPRK